MEERFEQLEQSLRSSLNRMEANLALISLLLVVLLLRGCGQ